MADGKWDMREGAAVVAAADSLSVLFGGGDPNVEQKIVGTGEKKRQLYRVTFADGSVLDVPIGSAPSFSDQVINRLRSGSSVVDRQPGSFAE